MRLRPKQQRFIAEYLVDLNARQAAIRAGYSKATANSAGHRLLKNVDVSAALEAAMAERQIRREITADRVLRESAKIAFLDARKFFPPDGSLMPVHEPDDDAAASGLPEFQYFSTPLWRRRSRVRACCSGSCKPGSSGGGPSLGRTRTIT